ncbi:DUF559 domain-containing protein [Blastococcus sp. CT_GayMR19]|uniref:DUF559 domain-containing protein n=1 Tax=Blastococcus sp. CT_GayMR19 TaxID=2559608 RepID=UPI00107384DB|nr:DUF559 domain-containing protein [Blastococcus sp. CT_GayMR19]TFV76909.1 DUF559 domain-containing protein [Blastococcus sp. CT_GayMR19]
MHDLAALLGPSGTASTSALGRSVDRTTVSRWLSSGRLVRLHPGWVTLSELAEDWTVRAHAAVGYTGGVLSHMSALAVHGLLDEPVTRLDVTVPADRRLRSGRRLRVYRSTRPCGAVRVSGLPVTSVARALVDTWGAAHRIRSMRGVDSVARDLVFRATRRGGATTAGIEAELAARPELPGRAALTELLGLVAAGSQSELEIRGLRDVLTVPGLPAPHLQYRVDLPGGPVRLDAAWPELKIAVEFDGAAFHGSLGARERDLRRDAALAALGWVVLRFGYRDVTRRPEVCRAQIAATYRHRLSIAPGRGIRTAEMPRPGAMPGR